MISEKHKKKKNSCNHICHLIIAEPKTSWLGLQFWFPEKGTRCCVRMLMLWECFCVTCVWSMCEITPISLADSNPVTWRRLPGATKESLTKYCQLLIGLSKKFSCRQEKYGKVMQHLVTPTRVTVLAKMFPFRGNAMGTFIPTTPYFNKCLPKSVNHNENKKSKAFESYGQISFPGYRTRWRCAEKAGLAHSVVQVTSKL